MAKAKDIPELDGDADAGEGAAKVLRARFDEVLEFRGAALDFSDIKGVHDMRVASRRLRSALRDFKPLMSQRALKQVKKELKRLADALGAVRDLDVFIAEIERLQDKAGTEPVKEGIGKFLREQRGLRELARMDLTEALGSNDLDDLQQRFAAAISESASRKKSAHALSFKEAGREAIAGELEDLLDLGESIYEPFNEKALHKLRIAAKRLRYAIKLFVVCLGDDLAPLAKEIGKMQSFLGEVHDCDVWIKILGERLRQTKSANENDYQAAVWLLSEFVNKRTKEYNAALNLWGEWKTADFAGRLRTIIS